MFMMHPYFVALLSFLITIILIKALCPVAHKIDLVDHPGGRKHHAGSTPLVGGIAIAIGFCISLLVLNVSLSTFRAYLAGFSLLIVLGVLDDFNEVSARLRLMSQILVALLIVCWGDAQLTSLGILWGKLPIMLGAWSIPLSIVVVVACINAINMLDGINGLAAGTSFITLAWVYGWLLMHGIIYDANVLLTLLTAIAGFLVFNYPVFRHKQRQVFLGDAGSTTLGLSLCWFAIKTTQMPAHALPVPCLLWLLIVPIFDLASVTLRRLFIKKVSPFTADREHLHHLVKALGMRESWVTFILSIVAFLGGAIVFFFVKYQVAEAYIFWGFVILFVIYFVAANLIWKKLNLARRAHLFH